MFKAKKQLSFGEMKELRCKHEKVSEEVFILLSEKDELDTRKELVDKYGYHSNVTFYSDGSVFIFGRRKGVNGWIGRAPLLPEGEIPPT